jgi:3-deoxy-D-manno-octulosonate 8-phosphate phosphatase (KDO 8-P phosphatase)
MRERRARAPKPRRAAAVRKRVRGGRGRRPIEGPVKILFTDVDGTLTDGTIGYDRSGDSRTFWIRDGIALSWAKQNGVLPVAISGRDSESVRLRMEDLGVEYYGGLGDKVAVAERVLVREKVAWGECVMVGDDLPDMPMLKRVGWPIAVANAVEEVKAAARTVTGNDGGHGAVREVVEMVLRHNGTWDNVLERYEVR